MAETDKTLNNEEMLIEVCNYCHDGDFAVFEEKACRCRLFKDGENYFIKREFSERWDRKVVSEHTETLPVDCEDFDMDIYEFRAKYCHGVEDNEWISVYNIHRKTQNDESTTINKMLEKVAKKN